MTEMSESYQYIYENRVPGYSHKEAPMADKWTLLPFLSLHFSLVAMLALPMVDAGKVPALFIFGDSTVDVGTNNFLPRTFIRANFPHNGIDFPKARPTGRFSNGFNTADFLGMLQSRVCW